MATARTSVREGRLPSVDGTHLYWRAWEIESPMATFAVVHGLGEHSGRYERFAKAMAKRGFSTFAVDLRGMGKSEGERGYVDRWTDWVYDAATFVSMVEDHPSAGEVVPLGHSFGGVVVLSAILREAVMPRRFILSNPALWPKVKAPAWKLVVGRMTSRLMPHLTLSNEVDPATLSRDPATVQAYATDRLVHDKISARLFTEWSVATEDVFARAGRIRTPFLLILSQDDRLVDAGGGRRLAELATAAPLTTREYPERYHEPFNDLGSDEVFDDIAAWMTGARENSRPT